MTWQPIETAPIDGTPILVYLEKDLLFSRVHAARLSARYSLIGTLFAYDAPKPTHWMPLPEPPR